MKKNTRNSNKIDGRSDRPCNVHPAITLSLVTHYLSCPTVPVRQVADWLGVSKSRVLELLRKNILQADTCTGGKQVTVESVVSYVKVRAIRQAASDARLPFADSQLQNC
jgi:hypothetical protein